MQYDILCILAFGDKNMRELSLGWVYPSSRCQFHLRMLAEKDSSQFAGDFHSADNFSRGAYSNTGESTFFSSRSPISCKIPTVPQETRQSLTVLPLRFSLFYPIRRCHKSASFPRMYSRLLWETRAPRFPALIIDILAYSRATMNLSKKTPSTKIPPTRSNLQFL